ncbi:hypothetical protein IAR55_001573 [Kwoniella newhampshirensis]|uniref:Uncharacterized protein n=1 Tax=Kwoniella newhampshirensis TaxID=1651941 RepID=A0AAW0Z2J3_9TREE
MYAFNAVFAVFAVAPALFLLPTTLAAPAPDTIFLLKQSTFTPLGCSQSFHPTSILRQVPSPAACFSRCFTRDIAAYSQLQSGSGVLCACGTEDMLEGIGEMVRCRDHTWFLFENKSVSNDDAEGEQGGEEEEIEEIVITHVNKDKKKTPWSFGIMKDKAAKKVSWLTAKEEEMSRGRVI